MLLIISNPAYSWQFFTTAKIRFFYETGRKILQNKNKNVNLQRETMIKIYYNYDTDCKEKKNYQEKEKSALSSKM